MRITAAATALPRHYYPQAELIEAFRKHWGTKLARFDILSKLHQATGVDGRFLAMPLEDYPLATWGEANNKWIEVAMEIGEQAVCRALTTANVDREDIGAVFFVSITGVCSPSIEARLINKMGLNRHAKRIPIFGLGCVAGAAGIARAADYVKAFPDQSALLLSVELCSLTVQQDDLSVANLISSGLFGDGAAAVVVSGADVQGPAGPQILATRSTLYPDTEEVMGWDITEKGFRIVLSRDVPQVVQKNLGRDLKEILDEQGLRREDIKSWVIHTGGPRVLEAAQTAAGIGKRELAASWDCLRRTGNLSSASVLFVLEEVMKRRRPEPGTLGVLAAQGPGFCSEIVLLRW